jgi:hypothetical protein
MSLVLRTSVPFRVPLSDGVNTTLIVQLPPARTPEVQLSVSLKSPLAAMLAKVSVEALLLVRVTGMGGLDVPTACEPKFRLAGANVIPVADAENLTVCGLAGSLSQITRLP